jgi:hypothetical protein
MGRVMPLGELLILCQFRLRPVKLFLRDNGRDLGDQDPFGGGRP